MGLSSHLEVPPLLLFERDREARFVSPWIVLIRLDAVAAQVECQVKTCPDDRGKFVPRLRPDVEPPLTLPALAVGCVGRVTDDRARKLASIWPVRFPCAGVDVAHNGA